MSPEDSPGSTSVSQDRNSISHLCVCVCVCVHLCVCAAQDKDVLKHEWDHVTEKQVWKIVHYAGFMSTYLCHLHLRP